MVGRRRAGGLDGVTGFGMPAVCAPSARASVRKDAPPIRSRHARTTASCLGYEGMSPFELGVATEVFALARPELEVEWWYEFALCAERPGPLRVVGGFAVVAPHGLEALARADTIIVPGVPTCTPTRRTRCSTRCAPPTPAARGMVSICSGAFVLAATGLLDGLEAATHWRYAALLRRALPRVRVNADVLYLDARPRAHLGRHRGGIDLCLHLVRRDHGADVANRVARRMVVAAHRDGGQAQFIERRCRRPARRPRRARDRSRARPPRRAARRRRSPASRTSRHASSAPLPRHHRHEPGPLADRAARPGEPAAARVRDESVEALGRTPSASRRPATGGTSARAGDQPGRVPQRFRAARPARADRGADGADPSGRERAGSAAAIWNSQPAWNAPSAAPGAGVPSTATRRRRRARSPAGATS